MRIRRLFAALLAVCLIALYAPMPGTLAGSKYEITVDLTNQIVTVYDAGRVNDDGIVRQMICSTGRSATPTPKGTFYLPSKSRSSERVEWYYFPKYKCYAKWATRIRGGILFHSTLFNSAKRGPTSSSTRALGSKASHGCVRLRVEDAKFIALNCPAGTKCRIFASGKTNATLRSKLKKKTFSRSEQTYDSFLGRAAKAGSLPLSKGSSGTLVTQLQTRLKALGFYAGKLNGTVGSSTVTAWKAFQSASGLSKTSKVDQALWDRIFADNAATGTVVTLSNGSKGPAVTALQKNLITLLMLNGSADGSFGSQTAAAVKKYQTSFGHAATGSADTALQKEIISRAAQVKRDFGSSAYTLETVTRDVQKAKVKTRSGTKLRKSASAKAKSLKKLKYKAVVNVISDGEKWVKVTSGKKTGFVKRSALNFYTEKVSETTYVESTATPTPAPTATPTATPAPTPTASLPAVTPTPSPTPEISLPDPVKVSLPDPDELIAAAAAEQLAIAWTDGTPIYAAADSTTLRATVPSGTALEVLAVNGAWIMVNYNGTACYVRAESVEMIAVEAPIETGITPETEIDIGPAAEPEIAPTAEPEIAPAAEPEITPTPEPEIAAAEAAVDEPAEASDDTAGDAEPELIFGTEAEPETEPNADDGLVIDAEATPVPAEAVAVSDDVRLEITED